MSRRIAPAPSEAPLLPFPEAIREAREAMGLSQHELSVVLGLTVGTVSRWERGKSIPEQEQAQMLERLMGVTFVPAARLSAPSAERIGLLKKALNARSAAMMAEVEAKLSNGSRGLSRSAATGPAPQPRAARARRRTA